MAQVEPTGGSWASGDPIPKGLTSTSGYSRSKKLSHMLQEAVTAGSLKGAGADSIHQGAEQIGGSLTLGSSESQHFNAAI